MSVVFPDCRGPVNVKTGKLFINDRILVSSCRGIIIIQIRILISILYKSRLSGNEYQ